MKTLLGFTGSLLLLFLIFTALILPSMPKSATNAAAADQTGVISAAKLPEEKFIIGESAGRVAAFRAGEEKPFYISDTRTADLPEEDRKALEQGIKIPTSRELRRILEEYCS